MRVDGPHEKAVVALGEQFELGLPGSAHEQPAGVGPNGEREFRVHLVDAFIGGQNGMIDRDLGRILRDLVGGIAQVKPDVIDPIGGVGQHHGAGPNRVENPAKQA